jgi:hypothetical protein
MKITLERLREVLHYDAENGRFSWLVKPGSNKANVGDVAGSKHRNGYMIVAVDGCDYRAHRLAWFYVHGEWPKTIDHVNRIKDDNRLCNLREATRTENNQNRTSNRPLPGSTRHKGRWMAQIQVDGKKRYLGHFDTQQDAHRAYVLAKTELHPSWTA